MTLEQRATLQLVQKDLKNQLENSDLDLMKRCTLQDLLLEVEEQLGEFMRNAYSEEEGCINCSG